MSKDDVEIPIQKVVRESDLAWLVLTADDKEEWLPKSMCTVDEDDGVALVPVWLAFKKGLV